MPVLRGPANPRYRVRGIVDAPRLVIKLHQIPNQIAEKPHAIAFVLDVELLKENIDRKLGVPDTVTQRLPGCLFRL